MLDTAEGDLASFIKISNFDEPILVFLNFNSPQIFCKALQKQLAPWHYQQLIDMFALCGVFRYTVYDTRNVYAHAPYTHVPGPV